MLAPLPAGAENACPRKPDATPDAPVCQTVDGVQLCSQVVCAGDVAQHDGQVINTPLALELNLAPEYVEKLVAIEVKRAVGLVTVEKDRLLSHAATDLRTEKKLHAVTTRERDAWKARAQPGLFWEIVEHPAVWFVLGVAATAAAVKMAQQLRE